LPVEEADAQNKVVNGTGGPNEDYANYVETMKGCGPRHMVLQGEIGRGAKRRARTSVRDAPPP